jgi:hypothetical protein
MTGTERFLEKFRSFGSEPDPEKYEGRVSLRDRDMGAPAPGLLDRE